MARRRGKLGDHLATDDLTGFTCFASQLRRDSWGSYSRNPLDRNLQEIASPLNDPRPVSLYRGPNYEVTPTCVGDRAPLYIGTTTKLTNTNNAAGQALKLDPGIGDAEIDCTFVVH